MENSNSETPFKPGFPLKENGLQSHFFFDLINPLVNAFGRHFRLLIFVDSQTDEEVTVFGHGFGFVEFITVRGPITGRRGTVFQGDVMHHAHRIQKILRIIRLVTQTKTRHGFAGKINGFEVFPEIINCFAARRNTKSVAPE